MSAAMTSDTTRHDRLWIPVLMIAAILASFALACATPFAAFAAMLALTLPQRRGLALIAAAWALNQAIGYGALGYPWTGDSFLWGAAIGVAALAATWTAYRIAPRVAALPLPARAALAFLGAFAVFEILLFALGAARGETASFSPAIVAEVGAINALFLAALLIVEALLGAAGRRALAAG
jgi:hypothetical protein